MTALFACGTWRVKPAYRSSRLTGRSLRRPSMMWHSIHLNATLPAPGQTLLPKCLYDAELRLSSPPLWLSLPRSGTNRDVGGEGPSGMGRVLPLTAHWFHVGLVDYVAYILKWPWLPVEKGRQGGEWGELLCSPPHLPSRQAWVWRATAPPPQTKT